MAPKEDLDPLEPPYWQFPDDLFHSPSSDAVRRNIIYGQNYVANYDLYGINVTVRNREIFFQSFLPSKEVLFAVC